MNKLKNFILKQYQLLLIIALGLFILVRFNPLGLFQSTKIKLEDTALVIKELREIGELITAEYYGETIEALGDSMALQNLVTDEDQKLREVFEGTKAEYTKIAGPDQGAGKRKSAFKDLGYFRKNEEKIRALQHACGKSLKNFLEEISDPALTWEQFAEQYAPELLANINRTLLKREKGKIKLAYIGRGWVKAGFDLGSLDETNLGFSITTPTEENDTMYLNNLDPEILDADINPWFTYGPDPELQVPGYQIFREKSKVSFQDVRSVKLACKQSLIESALIDRDILAQALVSGEETFLNLFNFFRPEGEPEIKAVKIVPTPDYEFKALLLMDRRLEQEELGAIRQRMEASGLALTEARAQAMLLSLDKYREWVQDPGAWNRLLTEAGL